MGRARARGLHPGRARHSHAVRCDGDVQGGRRRADVPEIMSPTITRVLVANRGEIALRIIRACHEEGLEAVAVYSEVDRLSPHVRAADLAVSLGPPTAAESYLDIGKLVAAAQSSGCQAVHPGYGFLSERAPFAEAVAAASLEFIGPPAAAIRAMGDKTEARRRMQQAGVPIVPGSTRPLADHVQARAEAARLGFPVLVKAAAGGGGKGMRLVREEGELESAFEAATSEALKAFGAGEVYVEKYLERPRHIEIQILADSFGRVVSLGERECSIQRRHQKLIEEAPSVAVTPPLRRRMSDAATAAASAVGYLGAGTIEFLLAPGGEFYFLEMNTRLQVEHPVTELVYGVDIVREQLRVTMGQPLRVHAGTLQPRGHAIECRITAEDPVNDFLPATGVVRYLRVPGGPGVRWDGGIEEGNEVTLHYDPLIAKLIVWGETRVVALERMRRAVKRWANERRRGDHGDRRGWGGRGPAGGRPRRVRRPHRSGRADPVARGCEAAQELRPRGAGGDRRARRGPRYRSVPPLRAGSLRRLPAAARHLRSATRCQAGDRGGGVAADRQARRRRPRDRRGGRGVAVSREDKPGGEGRSRAGEGGGVSPVRSSRLGVRSEGLSYRGLQADGPVARTEAAARPSAAATLTTHAAARPRGAAPRHRGIER